MTILFCVGAAMAAGLLFNRFAKLLGLPNVTGYLIAGLVIGRYILNIMNADFTQQLEIVTNVALGFIAFSIGGEFKLQSLKSIGSSIMTITFMQALMAAMLVDVVLIALGYETPLALTLGAIATATAPAATLMVVRQYKAKGPVTNMLLPVVALDDAIGLIVFSISLSVAQSLSSGNALTAMSMLVKPLLEIAGSLAVGAVLGFLITFCMRFFKSRANRNMLVICAVFLGSALADMIGLSQLLLCMAIGAVFANFSDLSDTVLGLSEQWTPPLFLLFFVISGAELDLAVLPSVGVLGVIYIIVRALGKYLGAFLGATVVKAEKNIRKYLGVALLPQAGVAIGMSQIVISQLPQYGEQIRAVVLCATLVYEFVGPLLTKLVLTKAGEIQKQKKVAAT